MTTRLRLVLASLVLLASCLGGCARPASLPIPLSAKGSIAAFPGDARRSLAVRLALDDRGLHVRTCASAPAPDDLRAWTLGTGPFENLRAHRPDGRALAVEGRDARTLAIAGASGAACVSYDVAPASFRDDPGAALVERSRFRGAGEALFAWPRAFEDQVFALELDVDGRAMDLPVVASSLGVGGAAVHAELRRTTAAALRRIAVLGGGGGHATFDAPEGRDQAAWLGYSAFDPRPMAAEIAVFRGILRDHFATGMFEPATLLLTIDERAPRRFRVQRRTGGLLVAASGADPFDAELRLAIAHELVHAWIGDRLWIGDPRPGHEAETYWFHEGHARWTAREQLYRVGLLSPDEYTAEVNRLLAIVTTSPHARSSMRELAAGARARAPGVVPVLVARGALHATLIDARIRAATQASSTPASLDDVHRALLRKVEERPGPLPEERWHAAVAARIGEEREQKDHEEMVLSGTRVTLPPDALGGCFEAYETRYDVFDPGFDVSASLDEKRVRGLRAGGPAARAGLRDGDVIVTIIEPGAGARSSTSADSRTRSSTRMKVEVERDGERVVVAYHASAGSRRGQAFRRRAGLSDAACRQLAVRR